MNDALPTAMVSGYENHVLEVNLPDPNDRHVVAAGITAGASIILTWNLRHFPAKELKRFGLRRETPDALLSSLYDKVPDLTITCLANARRNLTKTRVLSAEFINILNSQNLIELAKRVKKHLTEL
jgi:hypothetical protein